MPRLPVPIPPITSSIGLMSLENLRDQYRTRHLDAGGGGIQSKSITPGGVCTGRSHPPKCLECE